MSCFPGTSRLRGLYQKYNIYYGHHVNRIDFMKKVLPDDERRVVRKYKTRKMGKATDIPALLG